MAKFHFTHSKLSKQPFLLKIWWENVKFQNPKEGQGPLHPFPSPRTQTVSDKTSKIACTYSRNKATKTVLRSRQQYGVNQTCYATDSDVTLANNCQSLPRLQTTESVTGHCSLFAWISVVKEATPAHINTSHTLLRNARRVWLFDRGMGDRRCSRHGHHHFFEMRGLVRIHVAVKRALKAMKNMKEHCREPFHAPNPQAFPSRAKKSLFSLPGGRSLSSIHSPPSLFSAYRLHCEWTTVDHYGEWHNLKEKIEEWGQDFQRSFDRIKQPVTLQKSFGGRNHFVALDVTKFCTRYIKYAPAWLVRRAVAPKWSSTLIISVTWPHPVALFYQSCEFCILQNISK